MGRHTQHGPLHPPSFQPVGQTSEVAPPCSPPRARGPIKRELLWGHTEEGLRA